MKVLFLSSWFPNRIYPFNGDFVERHALAVSGICEVAVIHVIADIQVKGKVFEIIEKNNQKLLEIIIYFKRNTCRIKPFAKCINLLRYAKGYFKGYCILKKKFGKPDIIHANIIFPIAIVAWLWSLLTRIPYIITEHWTLYLAEDKRQIPALWITRKAVKKAFAVTPVTKTLGIALQKLGYEGRFIVVPNVVDANIFKPRSVPISGNKIKILHVSSMKEEQKNILGIIHTIKRLSELRNDFTVTFVGDVQAHQQAMVTELGIPAELIVFVGEKTHAEVADYMQQSHFLILFSNAENLPCVIPEAFSCGIPVLSSDVGGISEWINGNNGLLVKPGNQDELLKGLVFMINNCKDFNSEFLHKFASDNFGMKTIAKSFYGIYKNALKLKRNG
jgi:glycosyltransferase involved in cell wall biosynthesis